MKETWRRAGAPLQTFNDEVTQLPLDRIEPGACLAAVDQRGVARPSPPDGLCDIGAYERSLGSDIGFLIDAVEEAARQGAVSRELADDIVASLQAAADAQRAGDTREACAALAATRILITDAAGQGAIDAALARTWLWDVKRISGLMCG